MWEIPSSIRTALMYHAAIDEVNAAVVTARVARMVSLLIGTFCLVLIVFSYPFIYLVYGADYVPVVPALILLLPGVWLFSIGKLLAVYLSSENRPEIGAYTGLVALAVTIILDIMLIPTLGIVGAAIASSVSYGVSSCIIAVVFMRMTHLPLRDIIFVQRQDLAYLSRLLLSARRRFSIGIQARRSL
jgi:O-antigen/teichoic acid export membrane protein